MRHPVQIYRRPAVTDRYIRSLGVNDFSIQYTEDDMHRDLNLGYENWSTPLAAAEVIEALLTRTLFDKPHQEFIKEALITCQTGTSRIVHPLQDKQITVGHKTGTGDRNASGQLIAINDAGFVQFPNGHRYTLVVFVKDSQESMEDTEAIIAQISEMVYQPSPSPDKLLSPADKLFSNQELRYSASNHTDEVLPISLPYSTHSDECGCGSPA